ncbi:MAG: glycosyltransferase, partial [Alphaproteobacteria bacterium]
MNKISIIIPVYNVEKYLSQCLDSILNQTFNDWEAICVNDGSTDKSAEILTKYANKDSRIKVINQENYGVSSARNAAVKKITGEWTCFLDADDAFAP